MGILRLASTETKRIDLGDEDFLDVRVDMSKRDYNRLLKRIPTDYDPDTGMTPGQADDFTTALFDALVTGWSLKEPATVENYLGLAREAVTAVDTALVEHFNSLTPSQEEVKKG